MIPSLLILALASCTGGAYLDQRQSTSSSWVLQTTPELFAGPTGTGLAPFLVETNLAPLGATTRSFITNTPLETAVPISGDAGNQNVFQLMGSLSPYFPNPNGFGILEYPLPQGSNVSQLHMLHRHGSRYPTSNSNVEALGKRIAEAKASGSFNVSGALSFLNTWSYQLGAEVLVPHGRQELFDSGVLHYYQYGQLYNTSTQILARTTTQNRMRESAENFMAGFFGLDWTNNATLELITERRGFNNSLAGYDNCDNSNTDVSGGGSVASKAWREVYLGTATSRFQRLVSGYDWTLEDTYAAQTLCPFETVAFGYSVFCDLFTLEEWQGFEYATDLQFNGNNAFQSPTGRAVGIAYVQEVLGRLQNQLPNITNTQANATLDGDTATFPLNQSLYFDFSHDTNIMSILTSFSLTQFRQFLPPDGPPASRNLTVSHLTPFAARLDIEVIKTPRPVPADRSCDYIEGPPTTYILFKLNQRTLPLSVSLPECEIRADGWCELGDFLEAQADAVRLADYDYACNGDYPASPYGDVTDGVQERLGAEGPHDVDSVTQGWKQERLSDG
ncbi:MAG: hypothetical protein M1837_002278 [Sclerophora amabilis]|nr:MAG: hypothetical protein M1837_002278 [Sclerophora amabilis]